MPGKEIEQPYGPGFLLLQDNSGQLVIEDAHIIFRNFAGREGQFNREGDRNFCVVLPPEIAEQMIEDEWNVKQLRARDEDTPGDFYIQVSVGFKNRPPNLWLISSKGRVRLGQHECEILDWVEIAKADIIVNPYRWSVSGKSGVKAYVKSLVITMKEDYLDLKYADVPELEHGEVPAIEAGSQEADSYLDDEGNEVFVGEIMED